jgi:hypothetical protein
MARHVVYADIQEKVDEELATAKYVMSLKLPKSVYTWIDKNQDGLLDLYYLCKTSMERMGFPILERVTFVAFAIMMAKMSIAHRVLKRMPLLDVYVTRGAHSHPQPLPSHS